MTQESYAACDICGARAQYYRASSGHKLCYGCLLKTLEKSVRSRLREYGVLRPGARILVPITCSNTMASLGLAILTKKMKRGHGSTISVAAPNIVEIEGANRIADIYVEIEPAVSLSGLIEKIKFDRVWSARVAKSLNFEAVLLPVTATDATLAGLEGLFELPESFGEPLEAISIDGVMIVSALIGVEASAISALALLSGLRGRCRLSAGCSRYARVLSSLSGPEGEFAPVNVMKTLRTFSTRRSCIICGGPAIAETCNVCKKLDLGGLKIRAYRE